jgi:hypothetical protein
VRAIFLEALQLVENPVELALKCVDTGIRRLVCEDFIEEDMGRALGSNRDLLPVLVDRDKPKGLFGEVLAEVLDELDLRFGTCQSSDLEVAVETKAYRPVRSNDVFSRERPARESLEDLDEEMVAGFDRHWRSRRPIRRCGAAMSRWGLGRAEAHRRTWSRLLIESRGIVDIHAI